MEKSQDQLMAESSEWLLAECNKLIAQYRECKTEHEKNRLVSKINYMIGKMTFEQSEMEGMIYGS
jgi:hypothetical protein